MENKEYTNIDTSLFIEGIGQVVEIKTINDKAVKINITVKTDNFQRYIDTIVSNNIPINKGDIVSFWGFYGCSFLKQSNPEEQPESSPKYARTTLKNSRVQVIPTAETETQEQNIKIHIPAAVLAPLNNNGLFKVFPSGVASGTDLGVDVIAIADNTSPDVYSGSVVGTPGPATLRYNRPSFYIYDATFCLFN